MQDVSVMGSTRAAQRVSADDDGAQEHDEILHRVSNGEEVPLSHAQEQLWFLQRLAPGLTAYNLPSMFRLQEPLDADALERAFQAVIDRHGILRTRFFEKDGVPLQQMVQEAAFALERFDLSDQPEALRQAHVDALMQETALHVFDLGTAPALVARLIRLSDEAHVLTVCLHHIVSDAWSNPILAGDLASAYRMALTAGAAVRLPALPAQYADYALWQRERLQGEGLAKQLSYWNAHLGPEVPPLELPLDGTRPSRQTFNGAVHRFALDPALAVALQKFCRSEKCTPFVVLLATWQMLLGWYSGQNDFAVGVANAGRHRDEVRDLVGFFITTQVFRARLEPHASLREICRRVRRDSLAALEHADLPLKTLLASRNEKRDASRSPLFQVMFGVQMGDDAAELAFGEARTQQIGTDNASAKFDLSLDFFIEPTRAHALIEYNTDLFGEATVERLSGWYLRLLGALTADPDQRFSGIDLLGAAERGQLAERGVNAQRYEDGEPVHRLFEAHAQRTPDAQALVFGEQVLSYGELNARANRLAHRLIALGVKPEARVGIAVERSVEMIVGILAILKAGGAYVPLDPDYPAERLAYMAEDSAIALLLTQSHVAARLPFSRTLATLELDTLEQSTQPAQPAQPAHDPQVALHGESLAYLIYTSGSTGRPKGVGIAHRALVQHAQESVRFFGLVPTDRMLQFSTLNFDGFVEQTFPPLVAGAAIVLRGPQLWDSETFYRELIDKRISVADLTTAYWLLLAQDFARHGERSYGALRQVHAGGEAMPPEGLNAWRRAGLAGITLLNTYGPTEATVTASILDCAPYLEEGHEQPQRMPIGTPLAGRALRVVGSDFGLVPQGAAGELCIGGALLARGYLGRAGLSAERFVADPFDEAGGRLYRTGDLVRWNSQGQLEYLGRIDHQVKIRGFRVELGEIEASLLSQPGVREAVVVANEGPSGVRLVGYVSGDAIDTAQLRQRLGEKLPDYMVPAALVGLQALPLNANGKVDRKALPAPEFTSAQAYEAPRGAEEGAVERGLAAIWAQVLGVPRVGRHDNFFELGGDSLVALKLLARINKSRALSVQISLQDLLEKQTIARLVAQLDIGTAPEPVQLLNAYAGPAQAMPLFCVPPARRRPIDYRPLARHLEDAHPVYGLCYTDDIAELESIEQMARFYVDVIRKTRPEGAVGIVGWSLGSVVAVHVAHLLEQAGVEVAFLGMVDSFLLDETFDSNAWYKDFRDFVRDTANGGMGPEAIQAMLDRFESIRSASDETVRDAVEEIVAAAGIGVKPAEIFEGIVGTRRVNAITEKIAAFPRLKVAPHFWWKKERAAKDKVALLSQFDGEPRISIELDADHQGIVHNAALLRHVHAAMREAQGMATAGAH
ncbi:amino acid adenylation domain-containing protein [Variovorax sp. ZS18.2.2]|uniref:amino acid adenylation domain-containing protein n=1 Tax=Variovorax sp. ZS18.2.2 TaxID=2971255 RepID=UPI002151B6FF|nr:amino acid adenylation domain-containing protein [Variovorax sp. ZS18.2.2]MCR6476690.1 amino acid adenylation domain-containing protein [Variovorax sp. ZS18.2.2]